jgi:formylglycine-generating enzyme required for sulfatase activity
MSRRRKPARHVVAPAPPVNEPSTTTNESSATNSQWIGLATLTVIVCFVAVWMYLQSRETIAAPHRLATLTSEPDSARFAPDAWYLPADGLLGFVEIPAGAFTMGSDPSIDSQAYANERWSGDLYQGKVDLPTFYIARYEVTIAQFRAFAAATNRDVALDTIGSPDRPIANVSWTDALAYARWLQGSLRGSARTPPALQKLLDDGWRVSLPSEAEWEKSARGTDGRIYPWGMTASRERANFQSGGTVPVGTIDCSACAYGLADMSGNVWELTRSPYQAYPYIAGDRPTAPQAEALFVMRGGAFSDAENNIRTAVRGGIDPGARRPFIGFRVVLTKF